MFNELDAIRQRLLAYIESAYHLSHPQLVQLRKDLLEQSEVICHSPFIESSARYKIGNPISELDIPADAEALLTYLASDQGGRIVFPKPYEHQADALESVLGSKLKHTIVTTGTGSGKTETFLLPILGRLAREAGQASGSFQTRAVRALLLYPMNALVNDQLSRLRRLFGARSTREWFKERAGRPVKFGRYTSRTPFPGVIPENNNRLSAKLAGLKFFVDLEKRAVAGNDPKASELLSTMRKMGKWPAKDIGDNAGLTHWLGTGGAWKDVDGNLRRAIEHVDDSELVTRHEIQASSPDLLVTNYSMLEYMMLRPIERPIFEQTRNYFAANPDERFILVLDEVHLYRGAQGTEVAMLIRRLRQRLELSNSQFQVITTSASFEDANAAKRFAAGLTGTKNEDFICLQGTQVPKLPSYGGTEEETEALASVSLDGLLSEETRKRFESLKPLFEVASQRLEERAYDVRSEVPASVGKSKCKVIVTGLTNLGDFVEETLLIPAGGAKRTDRAYLTIVDIACNDPQATIIASRDCGFVECICASEDSPPSIEKDSHFGLSRVLFEILANLGVVGRLINLTSRTRSPDDPETHSHLGAQEIRELAVRLFPDSDIRKAQLATDVLVEAASMAKEEPGATPLLAARVHRFFRGIPGIWACSDPGCKELPEPFRGTGLTGKLYVQPRRACDCGCRAFELMACRNCGTAMLHAYARSARQPDYLWTEDVGEMDEVDDAVVPIHLCLEDPADHESEDNTNRCREMNLEPLTGRLWPNAGTSDRVRPVYIPLEAPVGERKAGLFDVCPKCRDRTSGISDMATKGDEPFQHLVAAQLMSQPPTPGNETALQGRKLLVFSDGRQPASRLAGKLKSNSLRDSVRPLLIHGLRYVSKRWFDGDTKNVSLEHVYLSLLCGAHTQKIELRPQLKESEHSYYQDLDLANQLCKGKSSNPRAFEEVSSQIGQRTPADVLISLYEVLFNPLSGLHSLAIGCFVPVIPDYLQEMLDELKAPDFPEAIESDADRRYEFLSFWLGRMVRERAIRLPGTPNEWIGNRESGIRLNANSGKFESLMRVRLGSSFYSEQLSGGQQGLKPWQRFFQERFGTAGRADGYLVDPKRLAIDLEYPKWVRCDVCTFAMPDQALYRDICPECGAISSLKKLAPDNTDVYEVFQTRKGFYRKDIDNESHDLRPFVAEEHTAAIGAIDAQDAFSRAEWHEMRFQDLDVQGPGGERGGIVDILSCTTTMEVGIDIGSLTAVSLRNVPPNRANYQQRAGRAGRRGSSLSTVITYADQGTHDQRYFKHPADMISGPVTDPVLNLENTEIVRRHGFAMILSMFQRERIPALAHNAATANIFSSLGRVNDFRAGAETEFSFRGLQKWLVEHRDEVLSSLRSIVPAEYLESKEAEEIDAIPDRLLARLQAIGCDEIDPQAEVLPEQQNVAIWGGFDDDFFGDDDPVPESSPSSSENANPDTVESPEAGRQTANLLDRLFETATLPSYAFPTDVVSMTVFDRNRSTAYRSVIKYAPQQGLDLALSSYAPGRDVFIDGKRHYSFALHSPMRGERRKSWERRKLYFECERCGYAKLEEIDGAFQEGQVLDCPSCKLASGMGPALYWIVPTGFAHPVDMEEELAVDQPPDYTRPTQAKLNAPFHEGDALGKCSSFSDRSITVWAKKEELFLTNRGSEDLKNRGFIYCLKCGRIEPKGWHDPARAYLNNRAAHPKPFPDNRDQPTCTGFVQTVSLGTKFISDVSLFRFRMGNGVLLPPGSTLTKICLTTVAQALAIVSSDMLEIDRANIGAEFRAAQTEQGSRGAEADVYLYDTTPGGAGFVKAAAADPVALLNHAVELLSDCDCESSCYKCLRSYGNRFLHQDLDRELGKSFLRHVLGKEEQPSLDKVAERQLLEVLDVDLRDAGEQVERHEGHLILRSRGDRLVVLSHSLLPDVPATAEAQTAYANGRNNSAPIPHLLVKRALPAAIDRCLNTVGQRTTDASSLPAGLKRATNGALLYSFETLASNDATKAIVTNIVLEVTNPSTCFLLEIDGPQLEKFPIKVDGKEQLLAAGTVMAFERVSEPANIQLHDNRLRLFHSTESSFKATRLCVTLAGCKWSTFNGRTSITIRYASTHSRATPQKVAPESVSVIGKPIGIVQAGRFIPVSFP